MSWPLRQKWFWMLFAILTSILVLPLLIVWIILTLSPSSIVEILIIMIAVLVVVKSYKSWTARKTRDGTEENGPDQKMQC